MNRRPKPSMAGRHMFFGIVKTLLGSLRESPPLEDLSDSELMLRYGEGDERAFALLFERHQQPVYRFILRSCGQQAIADELVQDVFERVIDAADRYEPSAKFTTWLYTIARHRCIDRARRTSRVDFCSLQEPVGDDETREHQALMADETAVAPGVELDRQAFRDRLQDALETLPAEQREVFLLREVSGLKFREIADVVDTKVPTVKSRLRYALTKLRGELEEFSDHHLDADEVAQMVP